VRLSETSCPGAENSAAPPLVSTDQPNTQSTITSPTFSTTTGNELLLAFIATDYLGGSNTTVSGITGGGLTWALVGRTNAQAGTSEIWRAFAAAPLTNVSIVATLSQATDSMMTVASFSNVDTTGTNGSGAIGATASTNSGGGAPTATLTTTGNNSWVWGVGNDYDTATPRTVGTNQVLVHQYFPPVGDTYWVQRALSPTSASGTAVTLNDTAPTTDRYNFFIVEIKALSTPDVTPPTVSMTAPAQGATVSGSAVVVSASASDNVGISSVQFMLDGANFGAADIASPYSITWDSKTVANGSHTLTAVASDAAGNTGTTTVVTVTVDNDTTPPTVAMTAPAAGSSVSATVTVSANATDDKAVVGVQFKLDGTNLGAELTAAPYSQSWNTSTASNGTHSLTAVARDAAGNSTTSAAVSVTVANIDRTPPTVTITTPANGSTVAGTNVTASANASENVAVVGVQFQLDGTNLGAEDTAAPYSIAWNTATVANGAHSLSAIARDGAGNTATSLVTVTVNNDVTAPTVSITAPADGATVTGTAVAVSAAASDNIAVVGVQFLVDDGAAAGAEVMAAISDRVELDRRRERQPHAVRTCARCRWQSANVGRRHRHSLEYSVDAASDRPGEDGQPVDQRDNAGEPGVHDNRRERTATRVRRNRLSDWHEHDCDRRRWRRLDPGARQADKRAERHRGNLEGLRPGNAHERDRDGNALAVDGRIDDRGHLLERRHNGNERLRRDRRHRGRQFGRRRTHGLARHDG